ncbi:MAG TPA: PBP1A family penicillin-binding protein [Vicinamibacterales bacterium]|nr:PBP1A family penicillin-binding protein [Vicinamibacterales bacterium]
MQEQQDPAQPQEQQDPPKPQRRVALRVAQAGLVLLFVIAAVLGTLSGVLVAFAGDVPEISALDDYRPNTITHILARDGQTIGEFATERRLVVGYDQISPNLRNAIISTEDAGFNQHFGLSMSRIAITVLKDILTGKRQGASTITQQLARNVFLQQYQIAGGKFEISPERKIKEWIVAIQIEKRFTKPEIFTLYANQINLGHGAYGVEAASHLYFDKSAKDLTVEEAAVIAGIIQAPGRLSPFVNPKATLMRRNYVLQRMAEEGYITDDESKDAQERPLVLQGQQRPEPSVAPYFVEEIRKSLEQEYGADALYQNGLQVQSTLDVELQEAANRAVDRGLRRLDKRHSGFRKPRNILAEKRSLERFTTDRWNRPMLAGDIVPALVTAVAPKGGNGSARVRIGMSDVELPKAAFAWTRKTAAGDFLKVGDLVQVEVRAIQGGVPQTLALEQDPVVEGALLAIDNRTGQVRAMVGGFDFARSKFNRATQAKRQVGSSFKPFIYTTAIDRGYTPVSIFVDEPVSYEPGPNQPPYEPLNYDRKYEGPVTLRWALEDSRNIPAVKALAELGPANVIKVAARFGLPANMPPYLSLALGSVEETLWDMTSAYTAFPNQGVRMRPYSIVSIADREGNVIEENRPEPHEAIRADTAYVMTNLLHGVVLRGTAAAAKSLDWPLAGKTGTMDEYTDAWFIGFDPNITVGVWVGYDEKKPLGRNETGAVAALPIWMDFMQAFIDIRADRKNPPQFEAPGNIVFVTLDNGIQEAFINGTQPQGANVLPAVAPASN